MREKTITRICASTLNKPIVHHVDNLDCLCNPTKPNLHCVPTPILVSISIQIEYKEHQ